MATTTQPAIETADEETVAALAKALAHPARVRIVRFLLTRENCIGGDVIENRPGPVNGIRASTHSQGRRRGGRQNRMAAHMLFIEPGEYTTDQC